MWFKIRFRFTFNVFLSGMSGTLSGRFSEELEMREMVWAYGVIILFIVSEAWSLEPGLSFNPFFANIVLFVMKRI